LYANSEANRDIIFGVNHASGVADLIDYRSADIFGLGLKEASLFKKTRIKELEGTIKSSEMFMSVEKGVGR